MADAECVAPNHVFCQFAQQVLDDGLLARGDIGLSPAVQAARGFDTAEQQVLRRAGIEQEGLDASDLHDVSSICVGRRMPGPGCSGLVRATAMLPGWVSAQLALLTP